MSLDAENGEAFAGRRECAIENPSYPHGPQSQIEKYTITYDRQTACGDEVIL